MSHIDTLKEYVISRGFVDFEEGGQILDARAKFKSGVVGFRIIDREITKKNNTFTCDRNLAIALQDIKKKGYVSVFFVVFYENNYFSLYEVDDCKFVSDRCRYFNGKNWRMTVANGQYYFSRLSGGSKDLTIREKDSMKLCGGFRYAKTSEEELAIECIFRCACKRFADGVRFAKMQEDGTIADKIPTRLIRAARFIKPAASDWECKYYKELIKTK